MAYPLEDIRVLDISRVLAGPFAGRMFADLGADVVKLEPPDNDLTRLWGADIGGNPGYYHQQNVGKRNISIDLSKPGGALLVAELAKRADVVIENFRPGVANRLGVGYAALSAANPKLIMLSISGFGQDGPESQRAAFAPVIHAEAGLIDRQARNTKSGQLVDIAFSASDTHAALHGMVAVLAALHLRERTGLGQHIDMAMLDATLATDDFLHYAIEDSWQTRVLPSEVWDAPGGPILISADFRHVWGQFSREHGIEDPSPPGASIAEKSELRHEALQRYFSALTDRATLTQQLDAMNIAWGDVRRSEDAGEQPTARHRGAIIQVDDRAGGTRPVVQSPYRFSDAQSGLRRPAPWKGEHNAEVLEEWLGLDATGRARWADVLVG
jgi:crotonobetainyl-CoA:carnitine CoA-transferase CaiB-like acyl-CoA transferase